MEGEAPPQAEPDEALAIRVWNALANGHGGLDWAGLPVVAGWLGVTDLDGLLHRLLLIKTHKPDRDDAPTAAADPE